MKVYKLNPEHADNPTVLAALDLMDEIELRSTDGEFWGGFCDEMSGSQTRKKEDGSYGGAWYWEFFVYAPDTHAVNQMVDGGKPHLVPSGVNGADNE